MAIPLFRANPGLLVPHGAAEEMKHGRDRRAGAPLTVAISSWQMGNALLPAIGGEGKYSMKASEE